MPEIIDSSCSDVGGAGPSKPYWLFLALVFQAGTYLTQGIGWRVVVQFNGHRLGMLRASELSLAMLFVNQTLPSGGISGEAMIPRQRCFYEG
jgi:uncharacterized membrane protein YbhN (UPF0104 family)